MQDFAPGQRWISDSEPELGLGLVVEIEHRMLTLEFPDTGETRLYAKANAPLSRITFKAGDEIHDRDDKAHVVHSVDNIDGLLIYHVQAATGNELIPFPETALSDTISLNQPLNRLLSGQIDHSHWFELRAQTLDALHFIEKSSLLGLCSARTELIPHQLYIAHEVAQRYAPRVLLADEVGLGKTIEACLILQQQLFSGLASRILIIVPETLLHQWLVELLRRFNLAFSIFDVERCVAIAEDSGENPFFTEQLILCSNALFIHSPELHEQALIAEWDLLIVDEAHHLKPKQNKQTEPTAENIAYDNIEKFSTTVAGLLLLTATPDQLGQDSHFALLRLLDPGRFYSFREFVNEQNSFIDIASLIEQLEQLDLTKQQAELRQLKADIATAFHDDNIDKLLNTLNTNDDRNALIRAIVDRHGTGRILFRNTRKVIAGFPKRKLHAYPLACPALYETHTHALTPEVAIKHTPQWLKEDPRILCVDTILQKYKSEKILLICAHKDTTTSLEEYLRLRKGIRSSVFHEDMSILERDRAAAYFASQDSGAQILLCSEIGSEGRNFQFSHHLILFDLPLNPDLLEQRIGRLDRIGQKQTINIHVPYLNNTAQALLFHWYLNGLNAFEKTNPAAYKVFQAQEPALLKLLHNTQRDNGDNLITEATALNQTFLTELDKGRDRLLEINSFNQQKSQHLIDDITALENTQSPHTFLNSVFDNFGIDTEENSDHSWVVQPGENMLVASFPAVPDQGLTLTYNRQLALHREDIQFTSWHHPLVEQSIDLVLQGDLGKSAMAILQDKRLKSGSILVESLYRIEVQTAKENQLKRFLPSTTIRTLVDSQKRNLAKALSIEELNKKLQHIDKSHLSTLLNENKTLIADISLLSEKTALKKLPSFIKTSSEQMLKALGGEIKRLAALKQVNPNIREEEIDFLKKQTLALHKAFANASLQLEGIRLIFVA